MYAKDNIIAALQLRYDSYSAGAVLEMACKRAELADKPTYDAAELRTLRDAIEASRDRVGRVLEALDQLLESVPKISPAEATQPASETPGVASEDFIETTIVLAGLETNEGEKVLLCGASELLGDWDPERARPLVRDGKHWVAQITLPSGAERAFKFLIRAATGEVSWEPGADRTLVAKPRLDVTWR